MTWREGQEEKEYFLKFTIIYYFSFSGFDDAVKLD